MVGTFDLREGDVLERLRELPDGSVHMVCTSPPYFGLRDYGTGEWEGGDAGCGHVEFGGFLNPKNTLGPTGHLPESNAANQKNHRRYRDICGKCGARRIDRQIGLEATPEEWVQKLVEVFREVKRVLRDDACCFVNLGDSYGEGKQLIGQPWRLAFALQDDGWILRSEIIWAKGVSFCDSYSGSVMPESVTDRPTKSHETVFLLSKSKSYFYDAEAVREEGAYPAGTRAAKGSNGRREEFGVNARPAEYAEYSGTRNLRDVWCIPTRGFPDAHFAVFPPALIEPMVKAGTSERGCCPKCGAPWERVVDKKLVETKGKVGDAAGSGRADSMDSGSQQVWGGGVYGHYEVQTLGFRASCECNAGGPTPCTVLDIFMGSGTTAIVACGMGRNAIGIELNPEYAEMARKRYREHFGLFAKLAGPVGA